MFTQISIRIGRKAWDNAYREIEQAAQSNEDRIAVMTAQGDGESRIVTLTAAPALIDRVLVALDLDACLSPSIYGRQLPNAARMARDSVLKQLAALGIDRRNLATDLDTPDIIDGEFDGPSAGVGVEQDSGEIDEYQQD